MSQNCDICQTTVEVGGVIYDAAHKSGCGWAWMCEVCWPKHSHRKLGLGVGQKFEVCERQPHKKLEG